MTIDVDLCDFETDEIIEYLEEEGYSITKNDTVAVLNIAEDIDIDRCQAVLSDRVTAKDFLTDILGLQHLVSEEQILKRVKEIINQ